MALLPGYKGLGGTAKQVQNIATGEIMSRRKYAETVKRQNVSNETLAKLNQDTNPLASYARPAKGRKSIVKAKPKAKAARLKQIKKTTQIKEANKLASSIANQITKKQKAADKIKVVKFTDASLKANHRVKPYAVKDYAGLVAMIKQAQKSKNTLGYVWGIKGCDKRDPGIEYTPTLSGSTPWDILDLPDQDGVDELISDFIQEHGYFFYLHMWIKIIWKSDYAEAKAEKAGFKRKQYRNKDQ